MQSLFTFLAPYFTSPITAILFIFGAVVGSFLNVCILRIPEKTFFKNTRSVCPSCQTMIPIWHNVPIFSWFYLKGRAACCGAPLSKQYPLVEALTGFLFVIVYWRFPFVVEGVPSLRLDATEMLRFGHAIIFTSLLLVCSVIDIRLQIIPDLISLPMIVVTPVIVFFHPELDWKSALYGVILGGGVLYGVGLIYYFIRREVGMGFGDVKLLAAIGGWLGHQSIVPTIIISSIVGSLVGFGVILATGAKTLKVKVPYGPFLSLGAILYLLFGSELNQLLFYRD